jgi:FkbM family methyltransferase
MVQAKHGLLAYNQYCHWVGKALELYGEYCEHEIKLFQLLIKPTDVVWEIGANTGSQSPALAKCASKGRFVGFEPQIELFKIFTTNLAINGCENSIPLNFALGEEEGVIDLPAVNYQQPNNFGGFTLLGPQLGSTQKVELRLIDNLHYLPAPNFIKMDVEGMESMVLRGGARTIEAQRPMMYIENDRPDKSAELIGVLWDMGYVLYWHITPYYNPDNFFQNGSNIYGNAHSFNMLCLHESSSTKIEGLVKIVDRHHHPVAQTTSTST